MANIKSSKKDAERSAILRDRNRSEMSRMRTFSRKVAEAVEGGNVEDAQAKLREAMSVIAVTARKGIIHPNKAARRISRLNAQVKKLATATA